MASLLAMAALFFKSWLIFSLASLAPPSYSKKSILASTPADSLATILGKVLAFLPYEPSKLKLGKYALNVASSLKFALFSSSSLIFEISF